MTSSPISLAAGSAIADTSRLFTRENLEEAADKFEAVFVGMMLKSMRATKFGDGGLFDNSASQQFRDMQDETLAKDMATRAPIGIGKALSDFLARSQPALAETGAAKLPEVFAVSLDVANGAS